MSAARASVSDRPVMIRSAREASIAVDHFPVHSDPFAYSAHPHLVAAAPGNWLLVFTQARRREGVRLHPPQDPMFCNMMMRSSDEGRTWSAPSIVPDFGWMGVECAGLTALRSGAILLNQWRFGWHTLAHARRHRPPDQYAGPDRLMGRAAMAAELSDWAPPEAGIEDAYPWARAGGAAFVHRSDDGGATFSSSCRIDTAPFSGGYGMRGAVEVGDEIVLPLSDVPDYRSVFVVRSRDGGATWSPPSLAASGTGHAFEEPAPLLLTSGRLLLMLRDNVTRILHEVHSDDAGVTWSAPQATGIADYPADLLALEDGTVLCVAGRRRKPFGITLHCSADGGLTFRPPLTVRDDLPNRDLGYPSIAARSDGSLLVVYYAEDADGVTGIHASVTPPDWRDGRSDHGWH
jgi:hypothetical protein